jgi:hypothetical protein
VRLYSRPGSDLTRRFPLIVETLARLRSRSCIIDGEALSPVMTTALPRFDLVRYHRANDRIFLYAFDLIELNGDDFRRDPLEVRKATLASIVAKAGAGIRFNEHMEGDGPTVFAHACKLGLEGIASKRKDRVDASGKRAAGSRGIVEGGVGIDWHVVALLGVHSSRQRHHPLYPEVVGAIRRQAVQFALDQPISHHPLSRM